MAMKQVFNMIRSELDLVIPSANSYLLTWFFSKSQGTGQIQTFDLANNPPFQPFTPDHPDLPFPDPIAPDSGNTDSPSEYRPAQPSSRTQPNLRRRRLPSSSPNLSATGFEATPEDGTAVASPNDSIPSGRADGHPSFRKRRRLANMRADEISTNGFPQASNGSTSSSRKASMNGQSSTTSNGESHTNGSAKSLANMSYYGHKREEVTRIIMQSLYEMGYGGAASMLSAESGFQLETAGVATFRSAVLGGRWSEAERILIQSFRNGGTHNTQKFSPDETLLLAEDADRNKMLFYLREHKFLELLEAGDLGAALIVLRQELTPLNYNIERLHALSSFLMCPTELLREQPGWDGPYTVSRERLLAKLSKSISPSVMIPQHRLAILLDSVKQSQINNCLYHNTAEPPSLYSDHMCDRNDFPLQVTHDLTQHSDEVWYCEFSHDGTKLVTAGRDNTVLIYDTGDFRVLQRLDDHASGVAFASWSPDDSKLITCSQDKKARVWNVENGRCLLTIDHHSDPVTAAAWAADGESFVTASLDLGAQLCHWSIRGTSLHKWKGGFRVQDCALSQDGRRLVAADTDSKIHVFDFQTYEEVICFPVSSKPTSVTISRDSKHMLVSLAEGEIQLLEMDTSIVIRRFSGQKQGEFVIRSTFGGADENFVVSGSEDSQVYIWHKENGKHVETLGGHVSGCVNSISWNPTNATMFASAGDDCAVRIWTGENNRPRPTGVPSQRRGVSSNGFPRTSALRTTSAF
ncbi:uncharacterized protein N7477_007380 [Penicillium maclennaniae]|uniref:uncharacterized protein n=1 Tax=Penicillium maclennaniae TaxID=1343394 RepID=UPI00253F7320|nr:uncharacterized protein N7477_007380 [Penicillium maclennaniae]KAJ5664932.1 hypothetical protein N7477_007380 [Penicillium maclennaniae]